MIFAANCSFCLLYYQEDAQTRRLDFLHDWGYDPARSCIAGTSIRDSTLRTTIVIDNQLQNLHPKGVSPTQSLWCFKSSLHPLSRLNHLGWNPLDSRSPRQLQKMTTEHDCNPGWIKRVQPASQMIFGHPTGGCCGCRTLFKMGMNTTNGC